MSCHCHCLYRDASTVTACMGVWKAHSDGVQFKSCYDTGRIQLFFCFQSSLFSCLFVSVAMVL